MFPPPELRTSGVELLGSTLGMVLTAVVAVVGLAILIGLVYWIDARQGPRPPKAGRRRAGGGAELASPGQGETPWERIEHRHVPEGGHPHGKPSSWVLVAVVTAAFIAGGVAIVAQAWWLFWTSVGIVVLAFPAGWAAGIMSDTVSWGSTPAGGDSPPAGEEAEPGRDRAPASRNR